MSSLLPQLIPILVVFLFVAKWERDKVMFRWDYGKAYYEGFADGAQETRAEWVGRVQGMAEDAIGKLEIAIPTSVKVTKTDEVFSYDFDSGKPTAWNDMVQLPAMGIKIMVDKSGPIIMPRGQEWAAKWRKLS